MKTTQKTHGNAESVRRAIRNTPLRSHDELERMLASENPHSFVTDPNIDPNCMDCDECGKPKTQHLV